MTDHGFNRDVFATSAEPIEQLAQELSKKPNVVAVHVVRKVGPKPDDGLIVLSDNVEGIGKVIEPMYKRHSIKLKAPREIWISKFSYRNGKKAKEAFV